MLIGYVSDENYSAIADAHLEFERDGTSLAVVRSSPQGAVYAEIPAGEYVVTICKEGFGSKRTHVHADPGKPYHFRLLADSLLGYAWPKWARSGDTSEFRVHSVEAYRLSL
jgi:N,N-dimethylformamidase